MHIESVKLAFFSPTGTSRTIIQEVANGIGLNNTELLDLTRPDARDKALHASERDLLVVAVPVYSGRVPEILLAWLNAVEANNTPTVCIAVYGNRAFEDALLELSDVLVQRGCLPVAAAAFIGEHSFSSDKTPIAVARPDAADLDQADLFGRRVGELLQSAQSLEGVELAVPGNRPYRERSPGGAAAFIAVGDKCLQCGVCAEACPSGAIDPDYQEPDDAAKCIHCCACIKVCPEHARSMLPGRAMEVAQRLADTCRDRKEPEFFFPAV